MRSMGGTQESCNLAPKPVRGWICRRSKTPFESAVTFGDDQIIDAHKQEKYP